jgi:hypothetical protein
MAVLKIITEASANDESVLLVNGDVAAVEKSMNV